MILEETAPDGREFEIMIHTDVVPYSLPVVYPEYETFDYDAKLKWESGVYAWEKDADVGHEVVDHRVFHYEPPTEEELEAVRERRRKEERQLWEKFCAPGRDAWETDVDRY